MSLNSTQKAAVKAAILASTDPAVIAARTSPRDDVALANWANSPSTTNAWAFSVSRTRLFETTNMAQYIGLAAQANRDAWDSIMDTADQGIDASRQKFRNGVGDIWSAAQATNILTACTEFATQAQAACGGNSQTSSAVTAIVRNMTDLLTAADIGDVMNS